MKNIHGSSIVIFYIIHYQNQPTMWFFIFIVYMKDECKIEIQKMKYQR